MKQIVQCVGCPKFVGLYKSYKVKAQIRQVNPHTGEVKQVEIEGRICRECARNAGYKVKETV